jgi:hypothetical protein
MSVTSSTGRTERALTAGVARRALDVVSGVARGGPVRATADEGTPEALRIAAVVHAGATLAVAGAATAVASLFFVLPPALYVAIFAAITLVLIVAGVRALRRLRVVAGRGYLFWAGIGWGLVVASGAYLTHLTGFVPHLWLGWTLGMLVLGVLGAGAVQTAVAGILAALWVGAAALVGESLLPGLVILLVLLAFPLLARPSRLVGAALAVLALALAVAYALRLQPGTAAGPLAVVTVVAVCGVLRALAARMPLDALTGQPPRGCPSYGIRAIVNAIGIAALVVLPIPPVLNALRDAADGSTTGLLLPVGFLVVALGLVGRVRPGSWPSLLLWLAGAVALVGALVLPEPGPAIVVAALAVTLVAVALTRARRMRVTLALLVLATVLLAIERPWYVGAALLIALGGYVIVLAYRMRGTGENPGDPVPFGIGNYP